MSYIVKPSYVATEGVLSKHPFTIAIDGFLYLRSIIPPVIPPINRSRVPGCTPINAQEYASKRVRIRMTYELPADIEPFK